MSKVEVIHPDIGPLVQELATELVAERDALRRGERPAPPVPATKPVWCLLERLGRTLKLSTMEPLPGGLGVLVSHGEDEVECVHKLRGEMGHALYECGHAESLAEAAVAACSADIRVTRVIV